MTGAVLRNLTRFAFGAAGMAFIALIMRRVTARQRPLPCPFWLSGLLNNPYMNSVAGAEAILDRLGVEAGMKVLDVGCGPGRLTIPAARRVGVDGEVTALDIQPEMLRRVQKKLDASHLTNVRLVRAGAGDGQVGQDMFDRALLVTVLGEIPDRRAALDEIFQALKPGGILSVTEVLPDPDFQTPGSIRRLASDVGFEEQAHFGGFPAFTLHLRTPAAR
ncbi:MAG TPA: methyltransferase domain-containing protein [Aggregatilineales bacterium]|nr:methyltransferase domain-containing protein [Aggregatilineales bacterium]